MALSDKEVLGLNRAFPTPVADNKPLRDLQTKGAITNMQQAGATARSTASDLSRLTGQLAPHGLSPGNLTPEVLGPIRGQIAAERSGNAISSGAAGGVRIPAGTAPFALPDTYLQKTTAGHPLKGEAAELAKGRVLAKQKRSVVKKAPIYDEASGRFVDQTTTEEFSEEGKTKGGPVTTQRANDIQAAVAAKLKALGRQFNQLEVVGEDATHAYVKVDGVEVPFPIRGMQ